MHYFDVCSQLRFICFLIEPSRSFRRSYRSQLIVALRLEMSVTSFTLPTVFLAQRVMSHLMPYKTANKDGLIADVTDPNWLGCVRNLLLRQYNVFYAMIPF
jgi:hypothetical protein